MPDYSVWLEGFGWDIEHVSRDRALEVAGELLEEGFKVSEVRIYKDKKTHENLYGKTSWKATGEVVINAGEL